MTALLYLLGVVLFLLVVSVSIALHELGHLVPAKSFGVKVTHYMIGFGPTLFSFRRGETVYGVKALPLGGFIAMPGMYPPAEATHAGTGKPRRARLFARTMDEARAASNQEIGLGEEGRTFYALSVPKRLVVMFGGPCVNLVLGIGLLAVVLLGLGVYAPTTTVNSVVECAVPANEAASRAEAGEDECREGDPPSPAAEAGIEPGDVLVSIDGTPIEAWDEVSATVADLGGQEVPVVVERAGTEVELPVTVMESERPVTNADGEIVYAENGTMETEPTGFLGVGPTQVRTPIPVSEFPAAVADSVGQTFHALFTLPQKLYDVVQVATSDEPRDPEGVIGMVGVGRVAGEIVSTDQIDLMDKVSTGVAMLASLNLFLFAFNMVPLLPLDGGHIAVGLYEGARRQVNRIRGHGATGPFDTARLLPLTYVVVGLMLCMTVLLVYVDLVKPVRLFG